MGGIFEKWTITFISIVLEALPFILLGSLISALIQLYISEDRVKKLLPKNKILALLVAAASGVFFPICECAIVPIAKSLMKKGVPIGVATVFMLSVPIVNPIVIASTYYAFDGRLDIILIRVIGGIFCALLIGGVIDIFFKNRNKVLKDNEVYSSYCNCGCVEGSYFYNKSKIRLCLEHTSKEFLDISRYYIFGAFLSSIFIVLINDKILNSISGGRYLGIILMMLLAFLLSLCSEADAFIAKGFLDTLGVGSVSAFLILGPMLDLKNTILLASAFKKKFIVALSFLIVSIVFIFALIISVIL
ncbi:permease [Clostridium sp.]|uniref:permease n=1 Tax=Clostridium sp. TaxID=1506 RepID=UPI003F3C470F